jgi:glycosyltransferase involved in cell wall biosynthesis
MDRAVNDQSCVDVVIPVFNGRESIQAALNSVFEQKGEHIHRVIVIDDGSHDDTAQVVQSLCNPLIELVRTPNQGVARARNLGIEKSTAEWIAFLDADDVWIPGKLEAQLTAAREHCAGFVCGSVSTQSLMPSGPVSVKTLARGNFVATSSVMVKRSVLHQIDPAFTPGMSFAEDYLAWLKCVSLTPGYYLSNKLVDYTLSQHPRYRWGQILWNMTALNIRYASFLRQIDAGWARRLGLGWSVFVGTVRSVLSIIKRFIYAYLAGAPRK